MFTALFVVAAHVALLPLSLLMSTGTFAGVPWPVQFAAYLVSSLLASGCSVMAVTAVHGLLVLTAPRGRVLAASAALRSAMLCVLVIALPLVLRLPAQAGSFAAGSRWLYAAPPVWFLGVERWLLGDVSRAYVIPWRRSPAPPSRALRRWRSAATFICTAGSIASWYNRYRQARAPIGWLRGRARRGRFARVPCSSRCAPSRW
jgi:hypothetical protein